MTHASNEETGKWLQALGSGDSEPLLALGWTESDFPPSGSGIGAVFLRWDDPDGSPLPTQPPLSLLPGLFPLRHPPPRLPVGTARAGLQALERGRDASSGLGSHLQRSS